MQLRIFAAATTTMLLLVQVYAQQTRWASADGRTNAQSDDPTAKYIVDMERKWAEGVCVDNGVVARLLADDFQGTSTKGARFTKADELKDEKSERTAHDCGLDEAKVHFFGDSLALVYGRGETQPINVKRSEVSTSLTCRTGRANQSVIRQ